MSFLKNSLAVENVLGNSYLLSFLLSCVKSLTMSWSNIRPSLKLPPFALALAFLGTVAGDLLRLLACLITLGGRPSTGACELVLIELLDRLFAF
jgi:hypothetical protein